MFLKKLSIFKENKDEMKEFDIVTKLGRFVPCDHQPLLQVRLNLWEFVSVYNNVVLS